MVNPSSFDRRPTLSTRGRNRLTFAIEGLQRDREISPRSATSEDNVNQLTADHLDLIIRELRIAR